MRRLLRAAQRGDEAVLTDWLAGNGHVDQAVDDVEGTLLIAAAFWDAKRLDDMLDETMFDDSDDGGNEEIFKAIPQEPRLLAIGTPPHALATPLNVIQTRRVRLVDAHLHAALGTPQHMERRRRAISGAGSSRPTPPR